MTCIQELLIVGVKHAPISKIAISLETGNLLILNWSKRLTEELSNKHPFVKHLLAFGFSIFLLIVLLLITIATCVLSDPIEWVDTVGLRIEVILESRHLWFMLFLFIPAGHKAAEIRLSLVLTIFVFLRATSHIEILCVDILVIFIGAELWGSIRDELVEHLACRSHAFSFFFIYFKLVSLGLIFAEPGSRVALFGLFLYDILLVNSFTSKNSQFRLHAHLFAL